MPEPERRDIEIKIGRLGNLEILLILPSIMLIMAFLLDSPSDVLHGLYKMIISPDVLLTDYLEIGGIGATFFNASILAFTNIFIIYKLKLKVNGALIAAIFTIIGFSFLGKNIFNVWPMYLGGYLYVKYQKIEFKNILVIIMFSTALAPVTSELAFGLNTSLWISLPVGIIFGIFCGFIITPLSSHMNRLHDGYNLYNIGFTAGLLGTLINSLLKSFGVNIKQQQILSTEYDLILKLFLTGFFIIIIIVGFIINRKSFKGYTKILNFSGRLVSDYTQLVGYGLTFVNMGIMGLVSMFYVIALNVTFNGPIVGAIFTIVGFAAFGKHPRNTIPIMIGVLICGFVTIFDTQSTIVIMAGLFGTTLAPLAGKYGIFVGLMAGFIHLTMVMNIGIIHGGINLYNNGFSGGLVAAILFPLLNSIKKGD
ncbi:MFS family permease [Sedimentibacter acidaminivorans]|uniref:MFS family permease n=1 Tax=Sedimentibacter acidaminivorans TaxID=913099 RepID=A0ABS4GEX8_9FIRM|nr:DUF1576 domain-containing protein [Sedimentibacter acidaminivorans]MBP1926248.1 MFS family permease [Sedimentibacter acidaminivorans]